MNAHGLVAIWKKRSGNSEEEHFSYVARCLFGYYLLVDDEEDEEDAKLLYLIAHYRAGHEPIEKWGFARDI